ncbi:hypothetical protein ACJRO7_031589 [Eucalyptus globulus]
MEKEENYSAIPDHNAFNDQHQHHHQFIRSQVGEIPVHHDGSGGGDNNGMVDYMLSHPPQQGHQQLISPLGFSGSGSLDKLSFADVMQFADFGPKLALNQASHNSEDEAGIDPVCFLKFPVLNDNNDERRIDDEDGVREDQEATQFPDNASVQLHFLGEELQSNKSSTAAEASKNKRKRPRTSKTSEEVESQRMTHIAVERNRRRQMNDHLRVLRSLMPGSYVQRGDQASIIGGAIEFVRELEQLLQCLESQKRRRLYGDGGGPPPSLPVQQPPHQPPQPQFFPPLPGLPNDPIKVPDFDTGLHEETAESKSCIADVEVKLLGFDAMIKILSRRRPGQLIKTIAALEDLQLNILHTNITTIEQTVLYSFNVKVAGEARFTAEDIASSVQQIFGFIHANSAI